MTTEDSKKIYKSFEHFKKIFPGLELQYHNTQYIILLNGKTLVEMGSYDDTNRLYAFLWGLTAAKKSLSLKEKLKNL